MLDYPYLTYTNVYFQEDNLWVSVTQHVENWSYSDTGLTTKEAEERVLVIHVYLSRNYWPIKQQVKVTLRR